MIVVDAITDLIELWRRQRLRTLVTWTGVAWGTFAVSLLLAFGQGLEAHMTEAAQGMGRAIAVIWPSRTTRPWRGVPEGRLVRLEVADVEALRATVPGLELCSEEFIDTVTLRRGAELLRLRVSGVHPDYRHLRNLTPRRGGRFVDARDQHEARRVAFLGDRVADRLFGTADPIGGHIRLGETPFTVIGVLRPKPQDSDYGGLDAERVFVPASTHARLFGRRRLDDIVLRAEDPELQALVVDRVHSVLAARCGFDPTDEDALSVWDTTTDDLIRRRTFLGFDLLLGLSGVLTMMVGALGVANLMFVTVRQRRAELGLLLALGASPRRVHAVVLWQSLLTVLIGGLLGASAAAAISLAVRLSPSLVAEIGRPSLSPLLAAAVVGLLTTLGAAAGWVPARRAARIDPAEVLAG